MEGLSAAAHLLVVLFVLVVFIVQMSLLLILVDSYH